jgi:medium-chain acyl-[acyl-carrier-protein] hydrolase
MSRAITRLRNRIGGAEANRYRVGHPQPVKVEMAANNRADWFLRSSPRAETKLRLFCFPYAGGTASVYRSWGDQLPPHVEVIPVEPPGRGKRLVEPPFRRLPELIEALTPVVIPLLDMKYALFGHSMGATIAFELARELCRRNEPQPEQLFVSGRRAPQIPDDDPPTYNLPDDEFRAELLRLNGTPVEVLEHAELMNLMLPILRADFELVQTYVYSEDAPLRCPISVYGGLQDQDVPRESLLSWKQQTVAKCSLHMMPGDHFFLRSATRALFGLLGQELFRITTGRD